MKTEIKNQQKSFYHAIDKRKLEIKKKKENHNHIAILLQTNLLHRFCSGSIYGHWNCCQIFHWLLLKLF